MKKLLVALTMVIFVVGLAVGAVAAPGYHEVYEWDGSAWVPLDVAERYAEMYSDTPTTLNQYNFFSAKGTTPCTGPYQNPEAPLPLEKRFKNYLHLFPWIKVLVNETKLIWDVFKPGNYMSKAFVMKVQANAPVLIHFGAGSFPKPTGFTGGYDDGQITMGTATPTGTEFAFDDKPRTGSLLPKGNPGTTPDAIDVYWWWVVGTEESWTLGHFMTETPPDKLDIGPSPTGPFPTQWVPAPLMNSDFTIITDSDDLHEGIYISFYEDILVEECDSEGKYIDEFVISICPDP